jgi:hypothetical protein
MSGAEAILVLGVISSVISIIDGIKQVYDAAADAEGLPDTFREVAGRLPLVKTILAAAQQQIDGGKADEASCKAMRPVIEACEEKSKKLDVLFRKVVPPDDASRLDRYFKAARTLGKGSQVESLMKGMLEDLQLLANNHGIKTVTTEQITKAISFLSKSPLIVTSPISVCLNAATFNTEISPAEAADLSKPKPADQFKLS